jgi:hypothetical protein
MGELQPERESMEFEVKPELPKVRGRSVGLLALGLVAVAGVAAIVVALTGTAASTGDPLARFVPPNAIMYFSMATHPDQQPNFNAVADAWKNSGEAKQIEDALSSAITAAGYDWEKDILPWLGDRAGAGLVDVGGPEPLGDAGSGETRYREPFFVLAVQTRDRQKSDAFLADFRAQRESNLYGGSAIKDEVYRGVAIVYVQNDSTYSPYGEAYATIDDVIVMTIGPDNLKKAIDAALDGANLAAGDNFKATLAALPSPNVGAVYVDFAQYIEALSSMQAGFASQLGGSDYAQQFQEQQRKQLEQTREMLQVLGGMGLAMTYEPGGIRFDMVMQYFPDRVPEKWRDLYDFDLSPASNRVYDSIPASAVAAMNASSPAASWKAMLENTEWLQSSFGGIPGAGDVAGKIAEFERSAGIDLGADLLDLLNGEIAFAVLQKPGPSDPSASARYSAVPFEIAALFDVSDATRAANSLSRLLEALAQLPESSYLRVQPLSGLPYSVLTDLQGGVMLAFGVVDGRLAIGSSPGTLQAIDAADQAPLSADATFKEAMGVLPGNRLSSGYLQLAPVWNWLGRSFDYPQDCSVCNYLKPIKWISFGSEAPDKAAGLQRSTLHVGLEAVK